MTSPSATPRSTRPSPARSRAPAQIPMTPVGHLRRLPPSCRNCKIHKLAVLQPPQLETSSSAPAPPPRDIPGIQAASRTAPHPASAPHAVGIRIPNRTASSTASACRIPTPHPHANLHRITPQNPNRIPHERQLPGTKKAPPPGRASLYLAAFLAARRAFFFSLKVGLDEPAVRAFNSAFASS